MPTVHADTASGETDAACSDFVSPGAAGRVSVEAAQSPGLVLCRKTAREASAVGTVADLLGLSDVVVSRSELVGAARSFPSSGWDSRAGESPNPRLFITPGSLLWTRTSMRQESRSAELAALNRVRNAVAAAHVGAAHRPDAALVELVDLVATFNQYRNAGQSRDIRSRLVAAGRAMPAGRKITMWSAESRANMYRTLASLDYAPLYALGRVPAMVTLTYPADWQAVAPDAATVKAQLKKFRSRYERAWREPLIAFWKLEFQARGAPHIHLFMAPPHGLSAGRGVAGLDFRTWLSLTWAQVVGHPDAVEYAKHLSAGTAVDYREGIKAKDPKRLAVYFGKHGTYRGKEYQHVVPEAWSSTGRWWGYWHLKPLVVAVELDPADYHLAKRIARHHAARHRVAGQWVKPVAQVEAWRRRIDPDTGEVRYRKRKVRRPVKRLRGGGGFLMVNNGPQIAAELARALVVCRG